MSARSVADLLALAHEAHALAARTGDAALRADALVVASRALAHPDAPAFFGGLSLALQEDPLGNDPRVLDNDGGTDSTDPEAPPVPEAPDAPQGAAPADGDEPDEDSPAASPAYEGVTDEDGDDVDAAPDEVAAAMAGLRRVLARGPRRAG